MGNEISCLYFHFHIRELLKGETEGLLKLPTDKALLEDPGFHHYVELYAKVVFLSLSAVFQLPNTISESTFSVLT